ncbi:MAG: radical SAM protein [Elusimicrobiota bacterium]|jgi:putative pyruvate formate lyase activating enzyme|nr:radical SAM protein [Elusimicrobiota bacterium]
MFLKSKQIDNILNLKKCNLCPRNCGVDRTAKKLGYCKASDDIYIASQNLHFGEEPPISGIDGSGAIFFSHCNLGCIFCQNYPISHLGNGKKITIEELSLIMLKLQSKKAHNINFVTPSHYSNQIVKSILKAKRNGLKIPIVYNCSGYESKNVLDFLNKENIVDIYLVDMKYGFDELAKKYSNVDNYVEINKVVIQTMLDKVGYLELDEYRIAKKGLIIRHLMLPNNIENTKKVLDILSDIVDVKKVHISFMSQYHKAYLSNNFPEINRKLFESEYKEGVAYLDKKGFENGWLQNF